MDVSERRSSILVFFTFVANAYLVAFALDGAVSLVDEIWFAATGVSPLTGIRNWLALFVVLASLLMVFVVALVPQLPKLVFVPLIVAALWFAIGAPPFVAATGDRNVSLFLSIIQLTIATAAFLIVQLRAGQALLSAELLPRKDHLFLRIALASLVVVALIPVGLAGLGAWALATAAEEQTEGYLRFTWSEVQSRETVMRRDTKSVHLVATAHIAEASFYKELYGNIPPHAVILAEGITDKKGALGGVTERGEAAGFLGLDTQDVLENLMGPAISEDKAKVDGTAVKPVDPKAPPPTAQRTRPDVVRADIDASDFSPPTLRCLRQQIVTGSTQPKEDGAEPAVAQCSEADMKVFWEEILVMRNTKLLKTFDALADSYDVFIVPWGALHMPDLEQGFEDRGFKIESSRMLTLARYQTVAGHVFGGLTAYKLQGPGNLPYEIRN